MTDSYRFVFYNYRPILLCATSTRSRLEIRVAVDTFVDDDVGRLLEESLADAVLGVAAAVRVAPEALPCQPAHRRRLKSISIGPQE